MVQFVEKVVEEFPIYETITIRCRFCEIELANFEDVCSIKKYWEIHGLDMNWNAKFKIKNKNIICKCARMIGISIENSIYLLDKKSVKTTY